MLLSRRNLILGLALVAASQLASIETFAQQRTRLPLRKRSQPLETTVVRASDAEPELALAGSLTPEGPLAPAMERLQTAREALASIRDYTCQFSKREVVGRRAVAQTMSLKFRNEPFSVYMLYDGTERGREVLYVEGVNSDRVLVHQANVPVLGSVTVPLAVNAPEVLRENRYPITSVGLHRLAEIIAQQLVRESRAGDVRLEEFASARLAGDDCHAFRVTCEQPSPGRTFHQTVLYFHKQSNLLVRVEQFGFPRREGEKPALQEEYTYTRIETNVGLSDRDFDPRNRAYHFQ